MKKLLLSLFAAVTLMPARADEGMWIPMLIGKNYNDMVRMGLKLTKDDLYDINHSSIKDAIMQFGGGCTAEMISANGLLITNHHCGYGQIASLSTVEKNYLDNGFWALSMKEELPAKDLTVIFLENVTDVTDKVMAATKGLKGKEWDKKFEEVKKAIEKEAEQKDKYVANVKDYFNGNQYLLLTYKKYKDVRLVGTPPKSMGKYGGDTDNWVWPRHTADFSMFRVYAGKDNEPADYAADNVPYKPKKFLPISIKDIEEKDYAMIFGYPGRTNRYEVASGLDMALNEVNPSIVNVRAKKLEIMDKHMKADKNVYLKLTAGYQSISNYWKYYIGQTEQLKRLHVVEKKDSAEKAFTKWASKNAPEYKTLISDYNKLYADYKPYAKNITYYGEAFRGPVLTRMAAGLEPIYNELAKKSPNADTIKKHVDELKKNRKTLVKTFDKSTDKELFAAMTKMFYTDVNKSQHPDIYQRVIFKKFGSDNIDKSMADYADYVYKNTFLIDSNKFNEFVENPTIAKIDEDAAATYALSFIDNYKEFYEPKYDAYREARKDASMKYIKALMKMNNDKLFYPDANSTMRITYGQVLSYAPQDAVHYDYFTTLDGYVAKYKPNDAEFDAPKDLLDLYAKKDYGRYKDDDGTLHTCFITNNDITGGNSGSPVMNGKGEWIGIAFDANWEAMSGDIAFDKNFKRTICVDSRFVLWIIEKMGKANNLIEEMDIRR